MFDINYKLNNYELIKYFLLSVFVLIIGIGMLYLKAIGLILFLGWMILTFLSRRKPPEFPLLFALLLVVNVFEFASLEEMPFIQVLPGVRLNLLDIIVIVYFFFNFNKIKKFPNTYSRWLVNFVLIVSIIYVVIGFAFTLTPRGAGTNYLRVLFYILFYYYFFFFLNESNNFKKVLTVISFWIIIATAIQILEYFFNYRFTLPGIKPMSDFYSVEGQKFYTIGMERIYLWSRVTILMFITLPFTIQFYLHYKSKFYLLTGLLTIISFLIAMSRIWFLGLGLIFLVIFLYNKNKYRLGIVISLLFIYLSTLVFQSYSIQYASFDFLASLLGRTHSILTLGGTYGELDTFTIRVMVFNHSLQKFLESFLWGWGFGETIWNSYYSVDLGLINRLVFFGIIGVLPLVYYLINYPVNLIKKIKVEKVIQKRIILVSVLAIFIAQFPMYIWQIDFWGSVFVIPLTLIMALGDKALLKK